MSETKAGDKYGCWKSDRICKWINAGESDGMLDRGNVSLEHVLWLWCNDSMAVSLIYEVRWCNCSDVNLIKHVW